MSFPKKTVIDFIKYLLGFFELFLGLRLVLRLLGANPTTPIVELLYLITSVINAPFKGIFSNIELRSGGVFDLVTITAMVGYPIIVYLLIEFLNLVVKEKRRGAEEIEF